MCLIKMLEPSADHALLRHGLGSGHSNKSVSAGYTPACQKSAGLAIAFKTGMLTREHCICIKSVMTIHLDRKVLIYNEENFSRVCSALLDMYGFTTDVIDEHHDAEKKLNSADVGIFITSYPYGAFMLEEVRKRKIPSIILFDDIGECYGKQLHMDDNLYCMKTPIDYAKFKDLVWQLLSGKRVSREDFMIL